MRISDWSTDVCSSDLLREARVRLIEIMNGAGPTAERMAIILMKGADQVGNSPATYQAAVVLSNLMVAQLYARSEEHTSELQSLMRISYAVFCLIKRN